MGWNKAQPANSDKLRIGPSQITENWDAIETGDDELRYQQNNFADRTVLSIAVNPTAIANTFIDFCKTDALGNSEKFGIDEDSNVLQYSYGGRVGGPTTGATFSNIKWGTNTTTYGINNTIYAYGKTNANGTAINWSNLSSSGSGGVYNYTLSPAPSTQNWSVVVTLIGDKGFSYISNIATSTFTINTFNSSGSATAFAHTIMVCGGF